jgi:hypothetical protein
MNSYEWLGFMRVYVKGQNFKSHMQCLFIKRRNTMDKFILKRKAPSQVSSSFVCDLEMQE